MKEPYFIKHSKIIAQCCFNLGMILSVLIDFKITLCLAFFYLGNIFSNVAMGKILVDTFHESHESEKKHE